LLSPSVSKSIRRERTLLQGEIVRRPYPRTEKRVALVASGQDGRARIWIRDLDALEARLLEGTEEAQWPFWSPDSRFLAFRSGAELKRIAVSGGPVQTVCVCLAILPSAWSKEDVIVFGNSLGMMKVSAQGGAVTQLTSVDQSRAEEVHFLPSFLPDQHHFLYYRASQRMPDKQGVYIGSIDEKPEQQPLQRLLESPAFYVGDGRLLLSGDLSRPLMTQAIDVDRLTLVGEAIPIVERPNGFATASMNGVLAYGSNFAALQLTWVDRQGKAVGTIGEPGAVWFPRISPDNVTGGLQQV
jgi:hypothetical protein